MSIKNEAMKRGNLVDEMIQRLLKELARSADKANVRSVGVAMQQRVAQEKNQANQRHRKLVVEAKNKFWDKAEQLGTALKGQFGNKVKEAFQRQTISLKQFL